MGESSELKGDEMPEDVNESNKNNEGGHRKHESDFVESPRSSSRKKFRPGSQTQGKAWIDDDKKNQEFYLKSNEQIENEDKQKSVKELVKILESKLDSSNINNVKYCEQNFHFQKESKLFAKRKK